MAGASNKVEIHAALDETTFDSLENDYKFINTEFEDNVGLQRFREEYDKLMRALHRAHDGERRIIRRCRELKAEIVSNEAKCSQANKMTADDQASLVALRKETDESWKLVEASNNKENNAKAKIKKLKGEIVDLSKLLEEGATLAGGADSLTEMMKTKDKLIKEKEEQQVENVSLRDQIEDGRMRVSKAQAELMFAQSSITELLDDIQVKNAEASRELFKKDRMTRDLKQVRCEVEAKTEEIRVTSNAVDRLKNELRGREEECDGLKVSLEQATHQLETIDAKLQTGQESLKQQIDVTESVTNENRIKLAEVKRKEEEIQVLKAESVKLTKQREGLEKKLGQTEDEKAALEGTKEKLKSDIAMYENEMEMMKKFQETDRKLCDEMAKEKEALSKSLGKSVAQGKKQATVVKMHELSRQNLEQEIGAYREEAQKQRQSIYKLEQEREQYINDAAKLTEQVVQSMDELKRRELQIFENKKHIAEAETKLKQQQNLYEAVRSDRNMYSKSLIEAQDEIAEMKRQLRLMTHQTDQLTDDIEGKVAVIVRESVNRQKIDEERDKLAKQLAAMKEQANETRVYIEAQEAEESKLLKCLGEAERERAKQKKECDQVANERKILTNQLVQRGDELANLYEDIRVQQSVHQQGDRHFCHLQKQLSELKGQIRRLRKEKAELQVTGTHVEELKRQINQVELELNRERVKCSALERELSRPVNIHRWRKLEGTDPATYEMIQKIHKLQKRLIKKTEEIEEKEKLIMQKEEKYVELRCSLSRQPGPEVAEQLFIYQEILDSKTGQLATMDNEIRLYDKQIADYKDELELLNDEYRKIRQEYFDAKSRSQLPLRILEGGDLDDGRNQNKASTTVATVDHHHHQNVIEDSAPTITASTSNSNHRNFYPLIGSDEDGRNLGADGMTTNNNLRSSFTAHDQEFDSSDEFEEGQEVNFEGEVDGIIEDAIASIGVDNSKNDSDTQDIDDDKDKDHIE